MTDIKSREIQLPDFQRGWIWDDEHVRKLLASLSKSYPIGAVMMLETGNPDVRFKARAVEGVAAAAPIEPKWFILDGQQRLTSTYLSLFSSQPVPTTNAQKKHVKRHYYIDIRQALEADVDREDAVLSIPEDKVVRTFSGELTDYSTPEKEYAAEIFPLSQIFDSSDWRTGYEEFWEYDKDHLQRWNRFEKEVVKRFEQYLIPIILLGKDTPKDAVCQVFENVNTGGVALTVFELLTATFAADNYQLRDDWAAREARMRKLPVLHGLASTDFLQAITLLTTWDRRRTAIATGTDQARAPAVSAKRKDVLRLTLVDYQNWAERVVSGFETAARLLQQQKIFAAADLPYRTQVVPLAAILAALGKEAESDGARRKLARWYWCGVFGELYGSAVETRFAKDLPEVAEWVRGGPEPTTVAEANFAAGRLYTLRSRQSAAYKGLYALLMLDGGLDFRTGEEIEIQTYFDDRIDIHHIFPKAWCIQNGVERARYDCIVNKTGIAARTNRIIGGNAPSTYLERVQKSAGISQDRMDEILRSHLTDPGAARSDNFDGFFAQRGELLLDRIESAMGKSIPRESTDVDDYEAELDDEEAIA